MNASLRGNQAGGSSEWISAFSPPSVAGDHAWWAATLRPVSEKNKAKCGSGIVFRRVALKWEVKARQARDDKEISASFNGTK
jgi:hypothetical protein